MPTITAEPVRPFSTRAFRRAEARRVDERAVPTRPNSLSVTSVTRDDESLRRLHRTAKELFCARIGHARILLLACGLIWPTFLHAQDTQTHPPAKLVADSVEPGNPTLPGCGCPTPHATAGIATSGSSWFGTLTDTSDFPPRWHCGTWTALHGWVHIVADVLIWGAYTGIPLILVYYVRRRRDIPFPRIFWMFAAFILACGTGHLMEAVIFWWPAYRVAALLKVVTAVVSCVTVVALIPIVPRALSLPGVERLNQELQKELTRRRETAESLRASEDSFRLLVDGTRDYAILKLDRQGHVVNWNPGAQRIYGYDSDEIIGRHFSCFYSAEDVTRGKPQGELDTALANGQYSEEGLCIRKDGAEYWAQVTITAMFDRAGNHVGFWKITRDISERKRAERELRDSEVRIRSIVETAVDAIVTIDHRGAIDSFNPSAERLFGYSAREVLGQNVKMLMPPPFSAEHDQYIVNFLTTGVKKIIGIGREVTGLRKDGAAFPMELAVSEMVIGDKRMFTGIVRDISERKRAQQDLHTLNEELEKRVRRRTEQLEAVNSELEAFSYSVSHDLRAPVRALVGFSKILLEEHAARLNEEMNHSLQRIHENAEQMGRLVDDLLAFSRLGRRAVSKQHLHPGDMVQRIIDNLSTANADRQLRFHVGELPECQADAALLQQVFTNVLDNAVKYTRKRDAAEIEVGGEKRDGECVYFVRDNGAGFDMRYADKLFGVFQRLHRAEEFEGTGVGLAIVQRIIQRHGGRVWAEAAVDQGAKFTFTLPETAHD